VRQQNLAAPWRLARQDRPAALKFENNQYGGADPEAKNRAVRLLQTVAPSCMARQSLHGDVT
jgi:hypothetical protein